MANPVEMAWGGPPDESADDVFLTGPELAHRLRRSDGTIANWRSSGKGPPYMKPSGGLRGLVLYRLSDVLEWEGQMSQADFMDEQEWANAAPGMSLRDYFAGQALAAIVRDRDALRALSGEPEWPLQANIAEAAYRIADSMIATRGNSHE